MDCMASDGINTYSNFWLLDSWRWRWRELLTVWRWVTAAGNPRRFVTIIPSLPTIFSGQRWMRSSPPASPRLMIIAFLRKSTKWTVPGWHILPCCEAVLNSLELCVQKHLAIHDMNRLPVARGVVSYLFSHFLTFHGAKLPRWGWEQPWLRLDIVLLMSSVYRSSRWLFSHVFQTPI